MSKETNGLLDRFFKIFEQQDKSKVQEFKQFMDKFGVYFNLYKDEKFIERSLPFDLIPRLMSAKEFNELERGLSQRIKALNLFLEDIYTDQKIIKDKIIPIEFVEQAEGYLKELHGYSPNKKLRTHINGIDLVKDSITDKWIILEDNLRVPSGASYPLSVRDTYRKIYPDFFEQMHIKPIKDYPGFIEESMNHVNYDGINVVLTPGRFNSAYYEHSYLAQKSNAYLVRNHELVVKNKKVYFKNYNGKLIKVGAIYRRLDDEFIDPSFFNPESLIGVPGLMDAYLAGNVAILNAPGNGVGDDKGIYYFVPQMIKYYLGEEAILSNAPTYLPYFEKDKQYILENISKLVIKDVAEAGGYGVLFGHTMTKEELEGLKKTIEAEPRRFIAQELIEFYDEKCFMDGEIVERKADFRAYVVMAEEPKVWSCGLTRFALEAGNYLVNSSQGGGFKDTWVIGE